MDMKDPRHPSQDPKYKDVKATDLPSQESLKDTVARFLPLWTQKIEPDIKSGKNVLIVAHGNSLRALMQHLESMSPEEIMQVNMPTGIPLMYELDENLKVIKKNLLAISKL